MTFKEQQAKIVTKLGEAMAMIEGLRASDVKDDDERNDFAREVHDELDNMHDITADFIGDIDEHLQAAQEEDEEDEDEEEDTGSKTNADLE